MKEIERTTSLLIALLVISCIGLVILRSGEGFEVTPGPTSRCGIQLGGCETPGTHCMNGYCASTDLPKIPADSGLPVYP